MRNTLLLNSSAVQINRTRSWLCFPLSQQVALTKNYQKEAYYRLGICHLPGVQKKRSTKSKTKSFFTKSFHQGMEESHFCKSDRRKGPTWVEMSKLDQTNLVNES